jgi:phosphoribosylformylglycinamidine synthase
MMRAKVIVIPKEGILDPQGVAVQHAMHQLGMSCIREARVGKFIELQIDGENEQLTRTKLEQLCNELLSNPVIEDYQIIWEGKVA